MTLVTLTCRF